MRSNNPFNPDVMRHKTTSAFRLIQNMAEAEGWGMLYLDDGIGHDRHVFTHRKRKQVLEVAYRSSRPVEARWMGEAIDVNKICDVLTGVDVPKLSRRKSCSVK